MGHYFLDKRYHARMIKEVIAFKTYVNLPDVINMHENLFTSNIYFVDRGQTYSI